MKTKLFFLLILLSLASCSADDNEVPAIVNSGSFTHQGETYTVNRGYIIPVYTGNNPLYNQYKRQFYIGFSDGHITWENDLFVCANDVHQWIDFSLSTSAANSSNMNGIFPFLFGDNPLDMNNFISTSNVITDIVVENGQTVDFIDHNGTSMSATGSLEISSDNGVYTITYSYVDDYGDEVTGTYVGTLTVLHNHGS